MTFLGTLDVLGMVPKSWYMSFNLPFIIVLGVPSTAVVTLKACYGPGTLRCALDILSHLIFPNTL